MGCRDFGVYLGRLAAAPTKSLLTAPIQRHRARRPDVRSVAIGGGLRATVNCGDLAPRCPVLSLASGEVFQVPPLDASVLAPFVSIVDVILPLDANSRRGGRSGSLGQVSGRLKSLRAARGR